VLHQVYTPEVAGE